MEDGGLCRTSSIVLKLISFTAPEALPPPKEFLFLNLSDSASWCQNVYFYLFIYLFSLNGITDLWAGERWWQNTFAVLFSEWCCQHGAVCLSLFLSLSVLLHCGPFSFPSLGPHPFQSPPTLYCSCVWCFIWGLPLSDVQSPTFLFINISNISLSDFLCTSA